MSPTKMSPACEHRLLGPPEIYLSQPNPDESTFLDRMVDCDDYSPAYSPSFSPWRGYTENGSATYLSTGNPLLDFFFHVVPDTPSETVTERLKLAWNHDPLKALKLVCNLRGVRGTGKSDREGFYAAALWIHKHHPKTLACNVRAIADFGYFKDLPEILYRLHEGLDIREKLRGEWMSKKRPRTRVIQRIDWKRGGRRYFVKVNVSRPKATKKRLKKYMPVKPNLSFAEVVKRGNFISLERRRRQDALEKEKARNLRKEKSREKWRKGVDRYNADADYRFLHDRISEHFAECLVSDLKLLNSGEHSKISWASKWCPSLGSCFDKSTLLCEGIARRIFLRDSNPEYAKIDDAHYAYRIRDRLRKEFLVPLRNALDLPEVYMGSKRWDSLPYNRVPSVAMKSYKYIFARHDEKRFNDYLESVKRGESSIAAGALLPHVILASLRDKGPGRDVAELQWTRMVDDLSKIGKLNDCLAVCDVSDSMNGTPMEVCVALGLLISELSKNPWKGKVITFSTNPQIHKIKGDSLISKTGFIRKMDWGGSTDFQKVFDQILQVAVQGKLKENQMIKRLFVFSDMEFNQASRKADYWEQMENGSAEENEWETDYRVIQKKFRAAGYKKVPEIVFWNLRDSLATPVTGEQKGVALVSGFSKNMLKLFLEGGTLNDLQPVAVMERAISGAEYNKLVVVD
ncbi:hypothetical protein MKW92_010084 [Papaver armeniacum]|nr:hypothetical protein MKW92_010084 [Papaver armeniacum]